MKRRCFETRIGWDITLDQVGRDNFTVTYGAVAERKLSYEDAADRLGSAIMHALACEWKLDNRMKGEK